MYAVEIEVLDIPSSFVIIGRKALNVCDCPAPLVNIPKPPITTIIQP